MRKYPYEQRKGANLIQQWSSPQRGRTPQRALLSVTFSLAYHLFNGESYQPRATVSVGSLQPSGRAAPMVRTGRCESKTFTHAHRASLGVTLIPKPSKTSMERHMRTRGAPLTNTDHITQNHNGVNLSEQLIIIGYNNHSIRRITNQNNYNIHKTTKLPNEAKSIDESPRSNVPLWRLIAGNRHRLPPRIRIALRASGFSSIIPRKGFNFHIRFDGLLFFSTNQIIELIYYRIHAVHVNFNFVNAQTVFIHDALRSHVRVHRYPSSSLHWSFLKIHRRIDRPGQAHIDQSGHR